MTATKSRFGLDRAGHAASRRRALEPADAGALRARGAPGRGRGRRRRRFRRSTPAPSPAARPRDKYIVEEPGTKDTVWWGNDQPAGRARALRQPAPAHARLFPGPRAVRPGPLCRRRPGLPPAGARRHRQRLAQPVRAQHVHPPAGRGAGRFRARLHDPARARVSARSRELDGINSETFIFVNFARAAGADRRHRLCRRDQEIGVRLSQLRAAGARRAADALLGQCRPEGRRRDLLRPLRHRQDDACRPTTRAP